MKAGSASALVGERSVLSCDQGSDRWLAGVDAPEPPVLPCSPGNLRITLGVQEGLLKRANWSLHVYFLVTIYFKWAVGHLGLYMCRRRQWHPTSVLLPGKSHRRRSLVGCSPWGLEESDTTERRHFHFSLSCIGEGNGNPLQCSCLENPRDGGAWWAAVCGVAQSRTQLKRLSSSSSSSARKETASLSSHRVKF